MSRKTIYRWMSQSSTKLDLYDVQSVFHFIAQRTLAMVMKNR